MRIFYCDHFVLPLPPHHRFPMAKYRMLRERVAAADLGVLRVPDAVSDDQLGLAHDATYVRRVVEGRLDAREVRRIGFPWSPALVERSRRSVGGTLAAARAALDDGVAVNLAGGTHHAFADHGEGFCVFNDVAVAIGVLRSDGAARRFTVVDLDVHQGNGTAALFRRDAGVFTLSLHGANNYPFRKERSDLDVELPDGTDDEAYLRALAPALDTALAHRPDLLFYVAGADPYHGDRLGRLALSADGLAARDTLVFRRAAEEGVPVAVVMSGGYAPRVEGTVAIHFRTVVAAAARPIVLPSP